MKKLILIVFAVMIAGAFDAASQTPSEMFRKYLDEKKLEEAAAYIPAAIKENYKDRELAVQAGDVYMDLGRLDSALIMYRRAEDMDDTPEIMTKIAETLSIQGKYEQAIEIMKEVIEDEEGEPNPILELAQIYIRADSLSQAELLITRARQMDKSNPEAYVALGDLYFAQRVYALARQNYEEAISLDSDLTEARIKLATSYYWLANRESDEDLANELFTRSLQEWNRVTQADTMNARAYFEQGKILFFSKNYRKAAPALSRYVKLRPSGSLGRWYLAQSFYEVGVCDSAAPHLRYVAKEIDSVRNKAELLLARCYFDQKDYEKSYEQYQEIFSKGTDTLIDPMDYKRYGGAAFLVGDTTKSIEIYNKTIDKYPDQSCDLMERLGKLLLFMKKYDEAIDVFNKSLRIEACADTATDYQKYYFIGVSHIFAQRPDSAISPLKQAIRLDSNYLSSYVYLGDAYASIDSSKKAEETFRFVIEHGDTATNQKEMVQAISKLAGLLLDNQDYNGLLRIVDQWIELQPDSPYPYIYKAVAYQGTGNVERACQFYRKVLSIEPRNKVARTNMQNLGCE
ncbi:MAG: tetratricopeptide repeat protein [Candidatus Kapaibacterium sp.]